MSPAINVPLHSIYYHFTEIQASARCLDSDTDGDAALTSRWGSAATHTMRRLNVEEGVFKF